jgi:threonine aldolase
MKNIDLRSDTVTYPTPEMRRAMAEAEVGDDVFGEDPTINKLQEIAAERMGKEAALLVPSGTMGNLVAVLTHCNRGDELILGNKSHTFYYEAGGVSALGGVHSFQVPNQPDGTLDLVDIQKAIRSEDDHFPTSKLIIIENTQNKCGGVPISASYIQTVGQLAKSNNLKLHIDGARIFNAAVALETPTLKLVESADSITFCLSKGLCAPVGSVLCGSNSFIKQARRIRKQLGGGMRQAGILAAAGIVALNTMVDRLAEDHHTAKRLAEKLIEMDGVQLDFGLPKTNMVYISISEKTGRSAQQIEAELLNKEILVDVVSPTRFRLVTHYWINDSHIDLVAKEFQRALKS